MNTRKHNDADLRDAKAGQRCEIGENNTWRRKSAVWSRLSAQPDTRKLALSYLYHIAARFE